MTQSKDYVHFQIHGTLEFCKNVTTMGNLFIATLSPLEPFTNYIINNNRSFNCRFDKNGAIKSIDKE